MSAATPRLVVGLGNPGAEYTGTRHNAGFWFCERLADKLGARFNHETRFHGFVAHARDAGIWLLMPQTYMNRSGQAVGALARRPRLLLLDEPTTGLDPVARHEILSELMDVVRDERRGILFSSHNTQDVEQISDQITFIDRGRIIDASDKEQFLDRWRRLSLDVPAGVTPPSFPGVVGIDASGRVAVVTTKAYSPDLEAAYAAAGMKVHDVQRMTLEEIFVANVMSNRREHAR